MWEEHPKNLKGKLATTRAYNDIPKIQYKNLRGLYAQKRGLYAQKSQGWDITMRGDMTRSICEET